VKPYERDPDWQAAWSVICNDAAEVEAKICAVQTMSRIQRSYEADPALKPRHMFELSVLHDSHRRVRLEAIAVEMRWVDARAAELEAMVAAGVGPGGGEPLRDTEVRAAREAIEHQRLSLAEVLPEPADKAAS
jgi:hypothetical protein